jgi:hypothetical protein
LIYQGTQCRETRKRKEERKSDSFSKKEENEKALRTVEEVKPPEPEPEPVAEVKRGG